MPTALRCRESELEQLFGQLKPLEEGFPQPEKSNVSLHSREKGIEVKSGIITELHTVLWATCSYKLVLAM